MNIVRKVIIGVLFLFVIESHANTSVSATDSLEMYDFAPDFSDSIIAKRISLLKGDIAVTFNPKVRNFIDYFSIRNRDYTRKMLRRKDAYFPMFEAALKRHNMPTDLKYLTIVESGINPKAKSHVGALGMWQFMPATGKSFGLDYDYYIDERMDAYKATEAACKFLGSLYRMFGDWEMALAAYNCGPGNVRRAIRKSGYKKTFWEVYKYLPRETRSYVPQFMAVSYLMRHADDHNIYINEHEIEAIPAHDSLIVNQYFNLTAFAKESGICIDELLLLNPEIKRNVIPDFKKDYVLKVPSRVELLESDMLVAYLDSAKKKGSEDLNYGSPHPKSTSTQGKNRITHYVRSGDVLGKIASRYGVRVSNIKIWNNLRSDRINIGQKLSIYKDPSYFKKTAPKSTVASKPVDLKSGTIYTVKSGDSLWGISKKYNNVSVEQIKKMNNLSGNSLKVGQKLKLG